MNTYDKFMNRNRKYTKTTVSYCNADKEDLEQDYALIYYSNPQIEEHFLKEEHSKAWNLFRKHLRKELKKYMNSPLRVECRKEYERYKEEKELAHIMLTIEQHISIPITPKPKKKVED